MVAGQPVLPVPVPLPPQYHLPRVDNDTLLRTPYVRELMVSGDARYFRGLNQLHEYYVVDNTPYPYPIGAYPYQNLSVTMAVSLSLAFDSKYKVQGIRLIFLNLTLLLIYAVVIGVIMYRTRKIQA